MGMLYPHQPRLISVSEAATLFELAHARAGVPCPQAPTSYDDPRHNAYAHAPWSKLKKTLKEKQLRRQTSCALTPEARGDAINTHSLAYLKLLGGLTLTELKMDPLYVPMLKSYSKAVTRDTSTSKAKWLYFYTVMGVMIDAQSTLDQVIIQQMTACMDTTTTAPTPKERLVLLTLMHDLSTIIKLMTLGLNAFSHRNCTDEKFNEMTTNVSAMWSDTSVTADRALCFAKPAPAHRASYRESFLRTVLGVQPHT